MSPPVNPLSVLIVEDEEYTRSMMIQYIENREELSLDGIAQNGCEAVDLINENTFEVLFLDIQLPCKNGFEILEHITKPPYVIFTTVYKKYALDALEMGAVDYLVKPVTENRFEQAMERLLAFYAYRKDSKKEKSPEENYKKSIELIDILQKEHNLSYQEALICGLIFRGNSRNKITEMLQIQNGTLKNHLRSIYAKTIYPSHMIDEEEDQRREKMGILVNFFHKII